MKGSEFVYYAMRCRKQREMAQAARTQVAGDAHRRLASAYAERASLAMAAIEIGQPD